MPLTNDTELPFVSLEWWQRRARNKAGPFTSQTQDKKALGAVASEQGVGSFRDLLVLPRYRKMHWFSARNLREAICPKV